MASLSCSTLTTSIFHTPLLLKTPKPTKSKNGTNGFPHSCKKSISCQNKNNYEPQNGPIDRRNMLIGLGGLCGSAATLTSGLPANNTLAAIIEPDYQNCTLTDAAWDGSVGDQCCPPKIDPSKLVDFKFENYPNPVLRVRKPAHLAMKDPVWLKDYKTGIEKMRSLPSSDPRSLAQQARVHCAYCDGAYPVVGYPDTRLEVHTTWLFASFHRWEIYFFERILGKLIGKPGFALPYWNWDHPDGMRIPAMFNDINSPLYDPKRNPDHLTKVVDLAYNKSFKEPDYNDEEQIQQNLLLVRKQMLYVTKPELFFGAEYVAGDVGQFKSANAGSLERSPHNNIHIWTGQKTEGGQNMGAFWSAARDPIFYCHHANVDRMWDIWTRDLPGTGRVNLNVPDYLNIYFIFFDENANPVRVYIRDSFNSEKLGFTYQKQPLLWLDRNKTASNPKRPSLKAAPKRRTAAKPAVTFPKALNSVIVTKVDRPKKNRSAIEKEKEEEVLVISFECGMWMGFCKFDVYVNDDGKYDLEGKTQIKDEYAGSFTSLGHKNGGNGMMRNGMGENVELKLALTNLLDDIGAAEDEAIQVSIVPRIGTETIVITGVDIQFIA